MAYQIDLTGKVAFVTGASSGLGEQFAHSLANAGATVVIAARRVERLEQVAKDIQAKGGRAFPIAMDVSSVTSIAHGVAQAEILAGPIDILVNNSGVSTTQRLVDVREEDYDFMFNTNTKGSFFVAQEVAKRMIARAKAAQEQNQELPSARIINIASMAGVKALSMIGVYAMTKAAVIHMTNAMALEWGRYGININSMCPGYIETEINAAHWETDAGQKLIQKLPRKRVGRTQDLEGILMLLASSESRFINGAMIAADDGHIVQ